MANRLRNESDGRDDLEDQPAFHFGHRSTLDKRQLYVRDFVSSRLDDPGLAFLQ